MRVSAANDTLTIRQVYNFSVGDTFDYKDNTIDEDNYFANTSYFRKVLLQKTYSANQDSIYYKFIVLPSGNFELDTISNLDSIAIYHSGYSDTCDGVSYGSEASTYPGYQSDTFRNNCGVWAIQIRFTKNLGRTFTYTSSADPTTIFQDELIYYSNGISSVGTPYYIVNGSTSFHYIPFPEECATWTETFYGAYRTPFPPYERITLQLRTGNKIYQDSITYVELTASIENSSSSYFTRDSLIGYFYNDSVHRLVYFTPSITPSSPEVICDLAFTNQDDCVGGGIDSMLIGGVYRNVWNCINGLEPPGECPVKIIQGIGPTTGIINLQGFLYGQYPACGQLTCFSVCGQTLYPNNNAASCPVLTGVSEIVAFDGVKLVPNPTNNNCTIILNGIDESLSASVFDVAGREVLPLFSNQKISSFNFSTDGLSSGVYLVRITSASGKRDVVKLVKE